MRRPGTASWERKRGVPVDRAALTRNILVGMALGTALGSLVHAAGLASDNPFQVYVIDGALDVAGKIFIVSLKLLVVPLVFVSLACGSGSLGSSSRMLGIGGKTLGLYLITTAIAVSLALGVAHLVDPGVGFNLATRSDYAPPPAPSVKEVLIGIFPSNPVDAMAKGNMLQIIVFAVLIGLAMSRCGEAGRRVRATLDDWNEVIMRLVMMLMSVAPIGVFCLLATLFADLGLGTIVDLLKYFVTVLLVLVLHFVLTYGLMVGAVARLSPVRFLRRIAPALACAFSTSSSNATLPLTLETAEHRLGVRNEVASFTIPLGATVNMDGTAIMQGVATVFIAQAYNVQIAPIGYLTVVLTATLASIGTAGVPGVGLIMLAMVLQQVGLPVEGIGLIIGVDRLLDMTRTAVNVSGDLAVTTVVARSENRFDQSVFDSDDGPGAEPG
jgi:Na+/H+-dicarboxylate symporter